MLPPPKRQLRPTNSMPTTAETYGQRHGIPDDLQLALQNVGRKGRQAVSQGRTFDRTQSFPVSNSFQPSQTFMTDAQARTQAEAIIVKEELKARELRPFSSLESTSVSVPRQRGSSPEIPGSQEKLQFDIGARSSPVKSRGVKRREEPDESEDSGGGNDTEVEEDRDDEPDMTRASGSTSDDFPPVFNSPKISEPRLFGNNQTSAFPSRGQLGRLTKALPGRGWGKTMSAPVGSLGGMDVDMDEGIEGSQDGFDVSEWAKGEGF
ncbi:hypothetical protein BCR39DRAFT_487791 [Naematelia encephala]|uniref:Uncharacterized protein n=1 Tax=Naematelia encephala TaxID=71784 RepID=A0A1Y2AJ37_9TREE|nr:hypothetical protein BCR39DRAFT_487791 [Naematelia encephala]